MGERWLAPLRGVTIRAFREAFAVPIREAGFTGAFAPFIPANPGIRVNDRMLADLGDGTDGRLVPQVITKHPDAMRVLLRAFRDRGFVRADLNAGCPFPMIVRHGRGSGLFRNPDLLERLLAAGCEEMGPGSFSLKIRLGLASPDELMALMPVVNRYPLAVLTIHARTAKQMYDGDFDMERFREACAASSNPVLYNGDAGFGEIGGVVPPGNLPNMRGVMVGRAFVRALGTRPDVSALLSGYLERSCAELSGDRPVLGRMKELLAYWSELPAWRRLWPAIKICRTVAELGAVIFPANSCGKA